MNRILFPLICLAICLTSMQCKKGPAATEKVLNIYIWDQYLPKSVLDDFKAKTGITVNVANYNSNEELLEKLQSGVTDYDIVVPSDYMVQRMIGKKLIRPLDKAKLKGLENFDAKFMNQRFDPGNQYSIPYFWGTTGIGYNLDKTGGPIDSWDTLFDKKYEGQISMLGDGREMIAVALQRMGKGLNETDPAVLEAAAKMLKDQKPIVRRYDSEKFHESLMNGEVALAHGYNGQIAKAIRDAGKLTPPKRLGFVVPKQGGTFWMDNLCVPTSARHTASIEAFLNYVLQPEVAAKIAEDVGYGSPNRAAREKLPPEMLKNEVMYPPEEVLGRCKFMEDVTGDAAKRINQYATEIKAQ